MNIFILYSVGFTGANLVMCLLPKMTEGTTRGLVKLNAYYDVSLKENRFKEL